jgi:SAM-dependent methyltransferase
VPEAAQDGPCRVCRDGTTRFFQLAAGRRYSRCELCEATLLDPRHWPDAEAERACYLEHENEPADPGYRRFLSKLCQPLLQRLAPGSRVLDYGCGPGPALAAMLREAGHSVALYDPFFAPDEAPLRETWDAVACSEAAEHFHAPAGEFDRLAALLKPGGWLGVMTCFQTEDARFAGWHYRQDPTHVVFYREATLRHLAAQRGLSCTIPAKDVALMRRP